MTSFSLVFLVVAAAINLVTVHAISDEERNNIHLELLPIIVECSKEYGVTDEEIKTAKESGAIDGINPCLMACVFKKMNVMNAKGLFDVDKAEEITKKFLPNEDDQNKATDIIKSCGSVNDQDVSDGDEGCDRAKLLFECFIPFKGEFIKSS